MKHLIKVFALLIFFGTSMSFAQIDEQMEDEPMGDQPIVDKEAQQKVEMKTDKVISAADDDKRVYESKKHLAVKQTAEQRIDAMDTDGDFKISKDEAAKAENTSYSKHFAKIDSNADGFIDLVEMKAKLSKKKDKMKSKAKMDY